MEEKGRRPSLHRSRGPGRSPNTRRGVVGGLLALVGLLVLVAAPGWACVPQPLVSLQPASSGPAGTQVTVEGINFGSGEVEIRWNGAQGERLASAGGHFSVPVTIPSVAPGLYVVTAVSRGAQGEVNQSAVAPFQVVGPASVSSAPSAPPENAQPADGGSGSSTRLGALVLAGMAGLVGGGISSAILTGRSQRRPSVIGTK